MRILFFADASSIHTRRWVGYFAKAGHQAVIASWEPSHEPMKGVVVRPLRDEMPPARAGGVPLVGSVAWIRALRKTARRIVAEFEPDLVNAHFLTGYGRLAYLSGFHPCVVSTWGTDVYSHSSQRWLTRRYARETLDAADLVTGDSQDLVDAALRIGSSADRTRVFPFGVDTGIFRPGLSTDELRGRLGIGPTERVVLVPRSISPDCGTEALVRAASTLPPGWRVLLMHYGSDPAYVASIGDLVESLSLGERVSFVAPVPHSQLPDYYCLADVVVTLFARDSSPVSMLEAMACERPVIAADVPGVRGWIRDGVDGALVPVGDAPLLAEALRSTIRLGAEELSARGTRNRATIRERAEFDVVMAEVERSFSSLISTQRGR